VGGVEHSALNAGCTEVGTGQRELYSVPPTLFRSGGLSTGGACGAIAAVESGGSWFRYLWILPYARGRFVSRCLVTWRIRTWVRQDLQLCCTLLRDGQTDRSATAVLIAETSARSRNRVTSA
jgi:hypothetical protein